MIVEENLCTQDSFLAVEYFHLLGKYVNKEKENTISGSVTLKRKQMYSGTLQVLKQINKDRLLSGKLEPTILISAPDWRPFLLSGTINFKEDTSLGADIRIKMDKTLKDPINLDGKFMSEISNEYVLIFKTISF